MPLQITSIRTDCPIWHLRMQLLKYVYWSSIISQLILNCPLWLLSHQPLLCLKEPFQEMADAISLFLSLVCSSLQTSGRSETPFLSKKTLTIYSPTISFFYHLNSSFVLDKKCTELLFIAIFIQRVYKAIMVKWGNKVQSLSICQFDRHEKAVRINPTNKYWHLQTRDPYN